MDKKKLTFIQQWWWWPVIFPHTIGRFFFENSKRILAKIASVNK